MLTKDTLLLCVLLPAFAGVTVFPLEVACTALGCPRDGIPVPLVGAILLVVPFQYRILRLWRAYPRSVLAAAVISYATIGVVLWGLLTGRLQGW